MRKVRLLPLLVLTALAACGRDGERDDTMAADTAGTAETNERAAELLSPVRAAGMSVVEFGQLAMQRGSREDVRRFGETVATDHRALIAMLDSLGQTRGVSLQETQAARELSNTVRMAHAGLETMEGGQFDLAFIRAEVESHRQLLDRLDHELIPGASSADMRSFLQDIRAMSYAHLTRARQLLGELLGQPVEPPPGGVDTTPGVPRPRGPLGTPITGG